MHTWITCGAYDLSDAQKFYVQYNFKADLPDPGDTFTFAYSIDNGTNYTYITYPQPPITEDWLNETWWLNDLAGNSQVVIAFGFDSNLDSNTGQGPWLDDLVIKKYTTPQFACGNQDPGIKGVAFQAYYALYPNGQEVDYPIINRGDTTSLQHMTGSNANWVRLEFLQRNGFVNVEDYDGVIDSLCAAGISTLGLVDYRTLSRVDWNDSTSGSGYRQVFSNYSGWIANYYSGRVKYWEVWNEPDGGAGPIDVDKYASILNDTYNTIKQNNPNAVVLSGGLGSAWPDTALVYFQNLYIQLDQLPGAPRPFDTFADHPYPDFRHPIDPISYMHTTINGASTTIIQPFIDTMANRDSTTKPIWITELGWNGDENANPVNQPCTLITSRSQQAIYLKWGFDILRNEVLLHNGSKAISKLFWFGYMDFSLEVTCNGNTFVQTEWYGLYSGDRAQANQPTQCVFASYPDWGNCIPWKYVYLPAIEQGNIPVFAPTK
jgi:hypothetical protein